VRFDMIEALTGGGSQGGDRTQLVENIGLQLGSRNRHVTAAETHLVGETGMGTDGHTMLGSEPDRLPEAEGVAGVETASEVHGAEELEQLLLVDDLPAAEGLAGVGVEVDLSHSRHGSSGV